MNISLLEKYDLEQMYKVYDRWPQIAKESFETPQNKIDFGKVNHIVFAGMGGSGTIGDIFSSILTKTKIHVNVVKGYELPKTVDSDTLVIVSSVSGNTIEALTILESAHKLNCRIIVFCSGGKMEKFCQEEKIDCKIISQFHSPRASLTAYLYTILNVLHLTLGINNDDILESIRGLENLNQKIKSSQEKNNPALELAKWICGIPIIYYPFGLQAAAMRFKNSFSENAKLHAIHEDVIEACHNGIVSWERKSNINPILIEGQDDHIKSKERWIILKEFFQQNKISYREVFSEKGNILSKIINLIYLLDYTTIYKAVLDGIDPSPVKSIEFVKSKYN